MFMKSSSSNTATETGKKIVTTSQRQVIPASKMINCTSAVDFGPEERDLHHRHSISLGNKHRGNLSNLAVLNIDVESSPLLSFGEPNESSGAYFSGQLHLKVLSRATTFDALEIRLFRITTTKKSTGNHNCTKCGGYKQELQKWTFTREPMNLSVGKHSFIFNYVFPGDFPASTCSRYAMIDYQFVAVAKMQDGKTISHSHLVQLQRVFRPLDDAQSKRIFPPTGITASFEFSPVCYIGHELPVFLHLSGLKTPRGNSKIQWRPRKLVWRVEEHQEIITQNCQQHHNKAPNKCENVRNLCMGQIEWNKPPWKAITKSGESDASFNIIVNSESACIPDVQASDIQLNVWHQVIVDVVVMEEYVSTKGVHLTGTVQNLRSQFPLSISNRVGKNVAWDEETPPVYQDTSLSPPEYN